MAELERDESESDHDLSNLDLLLNPESDNEWLDSSQQIYTVTISVKPMGPDFPVETQGYITNSLFNTGVLCFSQLLQKVQYRNKNRH